MPRRSRTASVVTLALIIGVTILGSPAAQGQATDTAWSVESEGLETGAPDAVRSRVIGARTVRGDLTRLNRVEPGDAMTLDLAPGVAVVAQIHRVTRDRFNGHVIAGTVAGDPGSRVILVVEPDGLAGSISTAAARYEVRWIGNGLSSVMRNDPARRRGDIELPAPASVVPAALARAATAEASATTWTIDLLHVFTKVAASQVGGNGAIKAATKVAVAAFNESLMNSNVDAQVRLVGNKKVKYNPRGTGIDFAEQALDDLRIDNVKKAHKFRAKFGADIVSMAIEINDIICGLGYLNGTGSGIEPNDDATAFHVNSVDCLSGFGGLTLAHESGHNLGLNHDPFNARTSQFFGAYPYSFGHRVPGQFATVMSYSCAPDGFPSCPEIPYFSTPKEKVDGTAVGDKKTADNARSLQKDRQTAAELVACKKACSKVNS
jgi:hypothetical protein